MPPVSLWEERAARNEALFREVNEQVVRLARYVPESQSVEFLCECSDAECTERLNVPVRVYQHVRADGRRFILLPGHEDEEYERVVVRADGYVVVEKEGPAGRVAERLNRD